MDEVVRDFGRLDVLVNNAGIRLGNGGVIINISSLSRHGNAGQSNYSAAKAGVAALAVVWAKGLARHRIRAAAIAPGRVRTSSSLAAVSMSTSALGRNPRLRKGARTEGYWHSVLPAEHLGPPLEHLETAGKAAPVPGSCRPDTSEPALAATAPRS